MDSFNQFKAALDRRLAAFVAKPGRMYRAAVDPDALWATYLDSFPAGTNPMYRVRAEHDCSACRQFIKRFGAAVRIDDKFRIETFWADVKGIEGTCYEPVVRALELLVSAAPIADVFLSPDAVIGTPLSHEKDKATGEIRSWQHMSVVLPNAHVAKKDAIPERLGALRTKREMLLRAVTELTPEAADAALELIAQGSLYRGDSWAAPLKAFNVVQRAFNSLKADIRANWSWYVSETLHDNVCTIRNTSLGTLLVDLSEGMDLDQAVARYEAVTAPANYKRPKAIFTQKMLEDARKTAEELGLLDSLPRRFARLEDITVNNVLFADRDAKQAMTGGDPFGELAGETKKATKPLDFSKVEAIPIAKFVEDYLPGATQVEAYLENRHAGNLVSLIAPQHPEAKPLFAWGNGFSWAYSGNVADSMKERVKAAGGKVDGVLRFSIQWNEDGQDNNDLDAHAMEPNRNEIWFRNKGMRHPSTGMLDVDIIDPGGKVAVENITWTNRSKMRAGTYRLFVHCYNNRGGRGGFRAEVEADGVCYSFNYDRPLRTGEAIDVATVTLSNGSFTVTPQLPATSSSRKQWGLDTNLFHPVSVLTRSPNWWDRETPHGNGHYMFMLRGCVNPDTPNGFFNEYLPHELNPHRRVFEALGSKMKVAHTEDQLSGLGFSSTKRDELVVRVSGKTKRVVKIQF